MSHFLIQGNLSHNMNNKNKKHKNNVIILRKITIPVHGIQNEARSFILLLFLAIVFKRFTSNKQTKKSVLFEFLFRIFILWSTSVVWKLLLCLMLYNNFLYLFLFNFFVLFHCLLSNFGINLYSLQESPVVVSYFLLKSICR